MRTIRRFEVNVENTLSECSRLLQLLNNTVQNIENINKSERDKVTTGLNRANDLISKVNNIYRQTKYIYDESTKMNLFETDNNIIVELTESILALYNKLVEENLIDSVERISKYYDEMIDKIEKKKENIEMKIRVDVIDNSMGLLPSPIAGYLDPSTIRDPSKKVIHLG